MADPTPPPKPIGSTVAKGLHPKGISPIRPARWGFFKGLLTGAAIEVPALAAGVWVLARLGLGDATVPFMTIVRMTAIFAGIAAVLTAAGLGRLAAYASVDGGRRRAAWVAGRAHAIASIGLVVIAVIPHGHLPERSWLWLAYPATGIVIGAVCGGMIGLVCGGATPLGIGDVLSLAKQPSRAIRNLLAPEDLVKLGVALRDRTSNLFEGMFEPAAPPPLDPKVAEQVAEQVDDQVAPKVEPPATPTTEEATATKAKPE